MRADRLVLAGLEEGVWPAGRAGRPVPVAADAQAAPACRRRSGASACRPTTSPRPPARRRWCCCTSERRDGAPAVASRWLWRLQTLARGAGARPAGPAGAARLGPGAWTRRSRRRRRAAHRPAARPTPPVEPRPRELPVTGIERWVRDPYAVYARDILGLRPLERPDEPVEARARGTAIHARLRALRPRASRRPWRPSAEPLFAALLIEELAAAGMPAARLTRERALAGNVAPWVVAFERRRRAGRAAADRTDGRRTSSPRPAAASPSPPRPTASSCAPTAADILDFKTGAPPSRRQVRERALAAADPDRRHPARRRLRRRRRRPAGRAGLCAGQRRPRCRARRWSAPGPGESLDLAAARAGRA